VRWRRAKEEERRRRRRRRTREREEAAKTATTNGGFGSIAHCEKSGIGCVLINSGRWKKPFTTHLAELIGAHMGVSYYFSI